MARRSRYYRDKALNANDAVNVLNGRPKSPYHYNQFGANVGGPIQKDKHFFFVNYDGQRNTQPNDVVLGIGPAAVPPDPASQAGYATLQGQDDSWTRNLNQDVFLVKTDSQLTTNNRLTLRYNQQNFDGVGFENGGIRQAHEHSGTSTVNTYSFNGSLTTVLSSSLFNEARVQYAEDGEPGTAYSDAPEATVSQSGTQVLVIGRNFFSPRETTIKRWQLADNITMVRGAHKVKGGVDFQFDDILNFFPGNFGGSYTFNSLASFDGGRPSGAGERYVQAFPGDGTTGPTTKPSSQEYSFFVQDEWKLRPDLTFNAGLRYDLQRFDQPPVKNPDPQLAAAGIDTSVVNTDGNNWGPRLGLAWSPGGKKVIRGGYGIFYGLYDGHHGGDCPLQQRHQRPDHHVHGDAGAGVPVNLSVAADRRRAAEADSFRLRQRLPEPAAAASQCGFRVGNRPEHGTVGELPLRERRQPAAIDGHQLRPEECRELRARRRWIRRELSVRTRAVHRLRPHRAVREHG